MTRSPADMMADRRLYFVCDARPGGLDPEHLLREAIAGGVDVIQLREKQAGDEAIVAAAAVFRQVATDMGVPFILNDRPDLVAACGADGVHVGQDDEAVERAREVAGPGAIVGLSTHNPDQLRAAHEAEGAARPDYISVGPVWATPTKPGRPAAGIDYVSLAATEATLPWFAIGGIDESNVDEVTSAGATRIVVVRAIRNTPDPKAAAATLRESLGT